MTESRTCFFPEDALNTGNLGTQREEVRGPKMNPCEAHSLWAGWGPTGLE